MGLSTYYSCIVKTTQENFNVNATIANGTWVVKNKQLSGYRGDVYMTRRNLLDAFSMRSLEESVALKEIENAENSLKINMSFINDNNGSWYNIVSNQDYPYNPYFAQFLNDLVSLLGGGIMKISTEYDVEEDIDCMIGTTYIFPASGYEPAIKTCSQIMMDANYSYDTNNVLLSYLRYKVSNVPKNLDDLSIIDEVEYDIKNEQRMTQCWYDVSNWYNKICRANIYSRILKMEIKRNIYNFLCFCICKSNSTLSEIYTNPENYVGLYHEYLENRGFDATFMMKGLANVKKLTTTSTL